MAAAAPNGKTDTGGTRSRLGRGVRMKTRVRGGTGGGTLVSDTVDAIVAGTMIGRGRKRMIAIGDEIARGDTGRTEMVPETATATGTETRMSRGGKTDDAAGRPEATAKANLL